MSSIINNNKEDILYFKDEILKDMKRLEMKLGQKLDTQTLNTKNKIDEYETKIAAMTQKINNLANQISTNISLKDKIEEIHGFKEKIKQDSMVIEIRAEALAQDLKNAINKYDAILSDSVIYSGVIGIGAKFPSFHDLIDYTLNNINQLNIAKEKTIIDFKNMKKKYDGTIQGLKTVIETNTKNIKDINKKIKDSFDERFQKFEEDNAQRFIDIRMDNNKYAVELKEKAELLNENYKKVEKLKVDFEDRIKYEVNRIFNLPEEINKKLNTYLQEFENIKNESFQLSKFIKNGNFEKLLNQKVEGDAEGREKRVNSIHSKEPLKIAKNQEASLLKKYISGEITFDQYNAQRKAQNRHSVEEVKVEEKNTPKKDKITTPNQIMLNMYENYNNVMNMNMNKENIIQKVTKKKNKSNQTNLYEIQKEANKNEPEPVIKKKNYVMSLANEAEIMVIEKNSSMESKFGNINQGIKNYINRFKENEINDNNINHIKRKSSDKELLNNNNEDIERMIKLYNSNHKKYKRHADIFSVMNNTSFQEQEKNSIKKDELDEIDENIFCFNRNNSEDSSPKRSEEFNEEYKNKLNDKNHSFYLEEKQYDPNINLFGTGLIKVINYNKKKTKNIRQNKKEDILEFIKKSYDDQEINDEKKLFQLKQAIIFSRGLKNINRNNFNNNDIFSNTLSNPLKKNLIRNTFIKEKNMKNISYNKNIDIQNSTLGLTNENPKNINYISLEKISFDKTYRKKEIENLKKTFKKLNPIKLKGNNSSTNLRGKKSDEDDDKKLGKLVNKIKDIIPYENKISIFETANLDILNKNVFSKKKIFFEKKEGKEEKIKDLAMKKLNSVYQNEPKNIHNINNQIDLINNEK